MNTWLKPLIAFAVGILLGVGGMYLAGARPQGKSAVCEGVPDIAGLSSAGLNAIKDNGIVRYVELTLFLRGVIGGISGDNLILVNGDNPALGVRVTSSTTIFELPEEGESSAVNLKLSDLRQNDVVQVSAKLQGDEIVASTIIRDISPPQ